MSAKGHNSEATDDRLRLLVARVEQLAEEKKGIADDIKDVFLEAKSVGYDTKIMRNMIKLRAMDANDRREMDSITELYRIALGMPYV